MRIAEFASTWPRRHSSAPGRSGENGEQRVEIRSPITGRCGVHQESAAAVVTPSAKLLEPGRPDRPGGRDQRGPVRRRGEDQTRGQGADGALGWGWRPLAGQVPGRAVGFPQGFRPGGGGASASTSSPTLRPARPRRPQLGDAYRVEARMVIWEGETVLSVPAECSSVAAMTGRSSWSAMAGRGFRRCRVGHSNGLETEVREGLQEGVPVILHPSDKIVDHAGRGPANRGLQRLMDVVNCSRWGTWSSQPISAGL